MAASGDLIDFEVIEASKENIQSLPGGRSAKALAQIYSPPLSGAAGALLDEHTKTRATFERELLLIDEADDPLDIYDRYVKWTLDAYPSAQATPQSQLLTLLERATKAFQTSAQYKNDSRYLKLWLQYITLFSDAPREVFIFLARNHIGESLALYYEEYAAWLENAGRWTQAEEVYQLGISKNARPVERLTRKYNEFERRLSAQPNLEAPSSPALPAARPALAAKSDPYASITTPMQPASAPQPKKSKTSKMQIFADSEEVPRPSSGSSSNWDSIGSLSERRKENYIAPRPMAGETLKTGKTNGGMQKMMVFRDSVSQLEAAKVQLFTYAGLNRCQSLKRPLPRHFTDPSRKSNHAKQCTVNPNSGKLGCVAVNLEAVYPGGKRNELCFEELRALNRDWRAGLYPKEIPVVVPVEEPASASPKRKERGFKIFEDASESVAATTQLSSKLESTLVLMDENDENSPPDAAPVAVVKKARREEKANRTRKIEMPDVKHIKNETKTIQLNMDSPSGTKPKRKKSTGRGDATMTINTKEAMDEIYGIFSQPLASQAQVVSDEEDVSSEDESSSDNESTATGKDSAPASEYGDETRRELLGPLKAEPEETSWSDYSPDDRAAGHTEPESELPGFDDNDTAPLEEHYQTTVPLLPETDDLPAFSRRGYGGPIPNHRLPFMTPIAEATESSLGTLTMHRDGHLSTTKTPSRQTGTLSAISDDEELMSSPFQEDIDSDFDDVKKRVLQPVRTKSTKGTLSLGQGSAKVQTAIHLDSTPQDGVQKGPIIHELQCNPMDEHLRSTIIAQMRPSISTFNGYHRHHEDGGKTAEIKRWAKSVSKQVRSSTPMDAAPVWQPIGPQTAYTFRRELGAGTFAPVYLVENSAAADKDTENKCAGKHLHRNPLEAIKMEVSPSVWEFYILSQTHRRLGVSRAAESIIQAHEMHVYDDECFLIEQYRDQGTLLDLVNTCRTDSTTTAGNDEMLAMWLTVELLRTVEALHAKNIIHGDLKGDNMMVRLDDPGQETDWSPTYFASGAHGWSSKGISLIDFGRGIDMKHFLPNVGFVADWKTTETDCAEMREMRPWTYQIDYHGLAGTVHSLLFGKYMETVGERGTGLPGQGATKTYRIRESFKRYWQTDIWNELFSMLLNPLAHLEAEEGQKMPLLRSMKDCREKMESWLEENCEKGVGLKGMIVKLECVLRERRRKAKSSA